MPNIGSALPDPAVKGSSKEIWVSARTDGVGGKGTEANEYNVAGSTRFDNLLASLDPYTVVRARPGNYYTKALIDLPNIKFIGAGKQQSFIYLDSLDNPTPTILKTYNGINNDFTKIQGFTFAIKQSLVSSLGVNNSVNAVELNGDFCEIEDCEAVGMYSNFSNNKENFTFKLSPWVKSTNTNLSFTVPAVDATVDISVADNSIAAIGDTLRIPAAGWFLVTAKPTGKFTGQNLGLPGSASPSTVIGGGASIINEQGTVGSAIKRCLERNFIGDYGSSFCVFADYNKLIQADIDDCITIGRSGSATPVNGFVGVTGNLAKVRIRGGLSKDNNQVFYSEGHLGGLSIDGLTALNTTCSIFRLNGQSANTFSNIDISNSTFEMNNLSHPSNVKWAFNLSSSDVGNINSIRFNNVRLQLNDIGATTTYGFNVDNSTNLVLNDVIIDPALSSYFDIDTTFAKVDGLMQPDGSEVVLAGGSKDPYA